MLRTRGGGPRLEHAGLRWHQRQWQRIPADSVEISVDDYTYNLAKGTFSRLNKFFIRLPHGPSPR